MTWEARERKEVARFNFRLCLRSLHSPSSNYYSGLNTLGHPLVQRAFVLSSPENMLPVLWEGHEERKLPSGEDLSGF